MDQLKDQLIECYNYNYSYNYNWETGKWWEVIEGKKDNEQQDNEDTKDMKTHKTQNTESRTQNKMKRNEIKWSKMK